MDYINNESMQDMLMERYKLAYERIRQLTRREEVSDLPLLYQDYVLELAACICKTLDEEQKDTDPVVSTYVEPVVSNYAESVVSAYADPGKSREKFGEAMYQYLSCGAYLMHWIHMSKATDVSAHTVIHMELFLEIVSVLRDGCLDQLSEKRLAHNVQQTIYYHLCDYAEELLPEYLGYWFSVSCAFEVRGKFEWAKESDTKLHEAHQSDLALFINHTMKERILFNCRFWDSADFIWKGMDETILQSFQPKQQKLLKNFREVLIEKN